MKTFGAVRSRQSGLNMTSLIDVVFILLIFFMIGSRFEKPAISLTLPNATTGERVERQIITVSIDSEGNLYVEGKLIEPAALELFIAPLATADPELTASLECDGAVPFAKVTKILDSLKRAGILNVAVRHEFPR
jgi:biopolymer transport protein ExbD